MNKVIFDCDNTMGLPKKDVDDGLVLLYLLGQADLNLLGVTSVFGNSDLEDVNKATTKLLEDLNITEFPLILGAKDSNDTNTAAAEFLVEQAKCYAGELTILATGSLTNLKAAYQLDDNFFSYLKEVIIMGGITEPLKFGNKEIEELNFSCDPEATKLVLGAEVPVTVATGNLCLQAFFGNEELERVKKADTKIYNYIYQNISHWYSYCEELIGKEGFYMWDLVSAVYLTNSELYTDRYCFLESTIEDLNEGKLVLKSSEKCNLKDSSLANYINVPTEIRDQTRFKDKIFESWYNLS